MVTDPAAAEKVAVVAPAPTVTEAGTVRAALLSETATAAPFEGAAWERVIVQVEVAPELIVVGAHFRLETMTGAAMVRGRGGGLAV